MHESSKTLLWKQILIGTPIVLAGIAGAYYIYYHNKASSSSNEPEEKNCLDKAISLKNRGNKFFKAGQFKKASECYKEAITLCPTDCSNELATFHQNLAAAFENLHQNTEAIEHCSLAIEYSPRYIKALTRRASLYEQEGELEKCLYDVTASCILDHFQNNNTVMIVDRVLKKLGQEKGKVEHENLPKELPSPAFIKNYLSAFAMNPFIVEAQVEIDAQEKSFQLPEALVAAYEYLSIAMEKMKSDDYAESSEFAVKALAQFTEAPEIKLVDFENSILANREKPVAAMARARLLDSTYKALAGLANIAKEQFVKVGQEMYAHPHVRANALIKAACLSMTVDQDFAACLYLFQQAQTVCSDCPDVYLHRGQIYLLAEQFDEALRDFNESISLKPDFSVTQAQRMYTMYRRDVIEGKTDRVESRLREFSRLTEKYPTCLETHSLYAQVLTECGKFEESKDEFMRVIELAPSSGMAYAHRGLLQLRWNQNQKEAAEWFKKGIEVDPKCELILELLGQLSMEKGNFDEALVFFNRAIQEAKTLSDLAHLISLREGVNAQKAVCERYNISVSEIFAQLQQEYQQKIAAS